MPRYFCDYCQTYLTHDSAPGRKQHNRGWKHRENVKMYYEQYMAAWEASRGMPVGGSVFMPILPNQTGGTGSFANTGIPILRPPGAVGNFPPGVLRPGGLPPAAMTGPGGGGGGGAFPPQQPIPTVGMGGPQQGAAAAVSAGGGGVTGGGGGAPPS
ncbi:hypothetical protein NSK_008447 [Nannochloropsis salina CCMP1776]|uniref:Matrin-type domain-containing protein n=1 Tax=Nannochloropsis salina CCMP1776 TaxID=1027361 RepID=A0A4D9CP67_9STRA|nr:hypothetical protein NSK_008447 [Nannochloropsis salina CCMP1776]|eukprot:TFJ80304.1 hypothetical protein NSK_008447 [Nannochloropsis salina CCMP1776]